MGMFSYCCRACGPKAQFDWMPSCVIKVPTLGGQHVKGHYDGYGKVKVQVQGKKDPVVFQPSEFRELGLSDEDGVLPATDIYCNGNEAGNDEDKLILMMLKQSQNQMKNVVGGTNRDVGLGEDDTPRFCVPKNVVVMDQLTADQYETLVSSGDGGGKKEAADKNNSRTSSNKKQEGAVFFPKGAYVILDGLKSDAGKKLNGGKGIVLSKPSVTEGVSRYPVLLYATKGSTGELAVLDPTSNKKIKAENLSVDLEDPAVNQLLQEVSIRETMAASEKMASPMNHNKAAAKDALFWSEQVHKTSPGDFGRTISYANCLRTHNRCSEALGIFKQFNLEDHCEPSHPRYPHMCFDFSMVRSAAGQELDQAFEYAVKIPYHEHPDLAREALIAIVGSMDRLLLSGSVHHCHPGLLMRISRALMERSYNGTTAMN